MIFLDASAAAKRYCQERGSDAMRHLFRQRIPICSIVLIRCELISALNRRHWEGDLNSAERLFARERMADDLTSMRLLPVDDELIGASVRLLDGYPLKTLDSLYLAGALNLKQMTNVAVLFVSADRQLLRAAEIEGLKVLDAEMA